MNSNENPPPPAAFSTASPPTNSTWTPHAKSMTIGKLANHIASVPGGISRIAQNDVHEIDPAAFAPPQPKDKKEILDAFEASSKPPQQFIEGLTESAATATWRLTANGKEILAIPRVELDPQHHVQPPLSPPRPALRLPPPARGPRPLDLRPQRRRKPFRPSPLTVRTAMLGAVLAPAYRHIRLSNRIL